MRAKGSLIIVMILLMCPTFGWTQSGFSGAYIGQVTAWERPQEPGASQTETQLRWYNRLILRYEPTKTLAVRTALRRADYFQENTNSTDIYYGYVDWQPRENFGVMIGRQYPYNKMIRRAIDGASAELSLYNHLTVSGLVGVFAPTDRNGFIDNASDEHGSYVSLGYISGNNAKIRGSFYQQVTRGRILNFIGLDGRYPDLYGMSLYGFLKYNSTQSLVQEAEAQLRREFGEKLAAKIAYRYRDPNYDLPVWYWQFGVDPYSTLRLGLDYFLTTRGSLAIEYFSRYLSGKTIERYRLGWLTTNWSAGVIYSPNGSEGSNEFRAYGSMQHHFGPNLLLGGGLNYFDYIFHEQYEEPLNAFGAQLFAKYRILTDLTGGVRGYYLTNAQFSKDIRFVGELSYQF